MVVVFTTSGIIRLRSTYPKMEFFFSWAEFWGCGGPRQGRWSQWGASGFPHNRVGALKVALLALKVSKMSKNDHKREKIVKTHKIR